MRRFGNDRIRYYIKDRKVPPEQATVIVEGECEKYA
jgi:hypothetical protein